MLIIAAALALAQTAPYAYGHHIDARPGTNVYRAQHLCSRFENARTERERRRYVPEIKTFFHSYQGDRDDILLRCENRIRYR